MCAIVELLPEISSVTAASSASSPEESRRGLAVGDPFVVIFALWAHGAVLEPAAQGAGDVQGAVAAVGSAVGGACCEGRVCCDLGK